MTSPLWYWLDGDSSLELHRRALVRYLIWLENNLHRDLERLPEPRSDAELDSQLWYRGQRAHQFRTHARPVQLDIAQAMCTTERDGIIHLHPIDKPVLVLVEEARRRYAS